MECIFLEKNRRCQILSTLRNKNMMVSDSFCELRCDANASEEVKREILKHHLATRKVVKIKGTRQPIRTNDEMNRCWEICNECMKCKCGLKSRIMYGNCPEGKW